MQLIGSGLPLLIFHIHRGILSFKTSEEPMEVDFAKAALGRTGFTVHRLGLSASYRPGQETIHQAIDAGVNYVFGFGIDTQMVSAMKDILATRRKEIILATGAYNYIWGHSNMRRTLEKRLRQFRTDYIDVFLFLGVMKPKEFPEDVRESMLRFREEGKVRAIGISTHDRKLAGRLAEEGDLDVLMIRYNAAHRGAEQDIFPHTSLHNPGIVAYTATRWTALLRRPRSWPKHDPLPTPGQAYRFVLSNPHVHCCLTAPKNKRELIENLASLDQGPLSEDETAFMKKFGDAVYNQRKWFM
jgi:aryl-alcohol dehydrogenase-like predicted oxidoreductase